MKYRNVPDDWDYYWIKCSNCGRRYHASEGGCECEIYDDDWDDGEVEDDNNTR